jgi:hypothetical protein
LSEREEIAITGQLLVAEQVPATSMEQRQERCRQMF